MELSIAESVNGMTAKRKAKSSLDVLIGRVLASARESKGHHLDAWKKPTNDIRRLVKHDYVKSLRRHVSYQTVKSMMAAFSRLAPEFNREPMSMMSVDRFHRMAEEVGFHFQASPYEGEEGRALRGFYVTRAPGILKRPLIYVNTAYEPLAISTTFCHELGHHMSCELLSLEREPVHFFFNADYAGHLGEPGELAADVMVSFAGYPERVARKIFETPWDWGLVAQARDLTESALAEVSVHLKKVYKFDLVKQVPSDQRLHYLSGMIHYAKLRWALLAEYDL
ncbi:MAG TPA: hypothetical protein VJ718_08330 [Candidatus Binataceae bacterium]|nr:hypothetical protein [Candidatus Binataceae bacterium]